jgi:hypothetical protein
MNLRDKFHPKRLTIIDLEEFQKLSKDELKELGFAYQNMEPNLLIQKIDGTSPISSANYRSLYNLLFSGHKYQIVGVKLQTRGNQAPTKAVKQVVELQLPAEEFISPTGSILIPEEGKEIGEINITQNIIIENVEVNSDSFAELEKIAKKKVTKKIKK